MGNTLSNQSFQAFNLDLCLKEVRNIELVEKLRMNRFLKTLLIKYRKNESSSDQKCIVKLFIKGGIDNSIISSNILEINRMQKFLENFPFIISYNEVLSTDRICLGIRPYIKNNLYDRLSTLPYLTHGEKNWIVFQILQIFQHIHPIIAHGDIKLENFLLTSWGFVVLSDFSYPLKPTYVTRDTFISEFNYFFDTSGRQSCYIAPERILGSTSNSLDYMKNSSKSFESLLDRKSSLECKPLPSMDIFSLGCVVYQIYTDGKVLFKPSNLLMYSQQKYSHDYLKSTVEQNIENIEVREMISSMISLDPADRLSTSQYIINRNLFPYTFHLLYNIAIKIAKGGICQEFVVFYIKSYIDELLSYIIDEGSVLQSHPGYLIIVEILSAVSSKIKIDIFKIYIFSIFLKISTFLGSQEVLNRVLTCFMRFLDDGSDEIRMNSLEYILKLLAMVKTVDSIDESNLFSDYILPKFKTILNDSSITVRISFSHKIFEICSEAFRYHSMVQAYGTERYKESSKYLRAGFDYELDSIYVSIQDICVGLLIDPSSLVQREFIQNSFGLVYAKLNNVFPIDLSRREILLSHVISVLNNEDWILRDSFFRILPHIYSVHGRSMLYLLIPILTQGIYDSCEFVVVSTVNFIKLMIENFPPIFISVYHLIKLCTVFLIHPCAFIRKSIIELISTCSSYRLELKHRILVVGLLKPFISSHDLCNFLIFSADTFKVMFHEFIPFEIYYPIVNRQGAPNFFRFLSEAYNESAASTTEFDFDEVFETQNDSFISFLVFLKKHNYCSRDKIRKLILIKDYVQSYKKEQPLIMSFIHEKYDTIKDPPRKQSQKRKSYKNILMFDSNVSPPNTRAMAFSNTSGPNDTPSIVSSEFCSYLKRFEEESLSIWNKADSSHQYRYECYEYAKKYLKGFHNNYMSDFGRDTTKDFELILKFKPHTGCINRVLAFEKSSYFTTASDDCSVMIWDSEILDASNMKLNFNPMYTYNQMSGRISSIKNLTISDDEQGFQRIACASFEDSDIQVFDIFCQSNSLQKRPFHRCVVDLNLDGFVVDMSSNNIYSHPMLLAATLHGSILGYDLREFSCNPNIRFKNKGLGYFSALECDPFGCWCAGGTSDGCVVLWDFRYPSTPIKKFETVNKASISRMQVDSIDFSKVICSYNNSWIPISIHSLETGKVESLFSINHKDPISCTGLYNISVNGSLHVIFSSTDGTIRDWNMDIPKKSSIIVKSSNRSLYHEQTIYSIKPGSTMSPIETRESVIFDNTKPEINGKNIPSNTKSFLSDLSFFPSSKLLIAGTVDGYIHVYK